VAMKQLVMIRVLGQEYYKKVVEIDITKFKLKYRLHKDVIGTLDGMDVAICIDDYDQLIKEHGKVS
jgi:hypothetical protein